MEKKYFGTVFIFILATLSVFGLAACNGENKPTQETVVEEQAAVDSLAIALHEVDSILNSGQLAHLDVYEIGKIKNISISVQKASAGDWSTSWINRGKMLACFMTSAHISSKQSIQFFQIEKEKSTTKRGMLI